MIDFNKFAKYSRPAPRYTSYPTAVEFRDLTMEEILPFYKNDKSKNRNGGRIIVDNGKIYRFVQNCENYYGEKVEMYEIVKLNEAEFEEKFVKTILSPSKKGWNSYQMHNIDIIKENNRYYAIVDGGSIEKENYYIINKFLRRFFW